jgi:ribonuclease BN (tRNA processing enzyme)
MAITPGTFQECSFTLGEGGSVRTVRSHRSSSTVRRAPRRLRQGDAAFHRDTTISPGLPFPGSRDLVDHILAGYAYHFNVMPLDTYMPDAGSLVEAIDIATPPRTEGVAQVPVVVFEDSVVRVSAIAVTHGCAFPALGYRFDTVDGAVVFSGDTTVNADLIALAQGADILVHQVADLAFLEKLGASPAELERMAAALTDVTQVGSVAERARVHQLILNHYIPAAPDAITNTEWEERASQGFSGKTTAGGDGFRTVLTRRAL